MFPGTCSRDPTCGTCGRADTNGRSVLCHPHQGVLPVGKTCHFCTDYGSECCAIACPRGSFTEKGFCKPCGVGFFQNFTVIGAKCNACPSGRTTSHSGATTCDVLLCDNGNDCCGPGLFLNASKCTACPEGRYSHAKSSARSCLPCRAGTFASDAGQTTCTPCDGDALSAEGQATCPFTASTCPSGTFADSISSACTTCVVGMYNDEPGQSACKACPAGRFGSGIRVSKKTLAVACTSCAPGYVNPIALQATSTACKVCAQGKYSDTDLTACLNCPRGRS